jgi:3-hydroxyacyl-[acyl-carrier-protein] dehydratase
MLTIESTAAALFERACREPLIERTEREHGSALDEAAIRALLPHRRPFVFVDRVTRLDTANGAIVGRYDIRQDSSLLAGHFPGRPVWPGVLQIEAVGQTGLCLVRATRAASDGAPQRPFHLTDVLSARFKTAVAPGLPVEIVACVVPDGLFTIVVGQCLQRDRVCSAAAVRGLEGA